MLREFADFFLLAVILPVAGMSVWIIFTEARSMSAGTYTCRDCGHDFEGNLVASCPKCGGVRVDRLHFHD